MGEVILMFRLCFVERIERREFGNNIIVPVRFGTPYGWLEGGFLLVTCVKHSATILRSFICSLAIEGCRVVYQEKYIKHCLGGYDGLIESHLYTLGVTCLTARN